MSFQGNVPRSETYVPKQLKTNSPGAKGSSLPAGALIVKNMANIQQITQIDGVVLKSEALNTLKQWQEDDNSGIDSQINLLADAICYLAKTVFNDNGTDQELKALFFDLSALKDSLNDFRKP